MRVHTDITYPADPAAVAEMLADPAFVTEYCSATGAVSHTVDVAGDAGGAFTVTTVRTMPTDRFPDVARRFVGATVDVRQVDRWQAPDAGGRSGATAVEVVGAPVRLQGTLRLEGGGAATTEVLDADLTAAVPLVGGKLERAAEPALLAGIRQQEAVARRWLAGS